MKTVTHSLAGLVVAALMLAGCAGAPGTAPFTIPAAERLPLDPALVAGTLDNGLAYLVRRHANPPERIAIWLHVATGSLNETDDTRGLAHYLEHMAFKGSANFPPGSIIPLFQSLGMTFGRDQNAFTSFDQTVYTLALPDTKPVTLDRALLYLSDVAFQLSLVPGEIDKERQVILEEKRARAGAYQRAREQALTHLAPESMLGRRWPLGTEEAIRSVGAAKFQDYYRRWYVPANMTVIAVGDVEPATVVEAITRHFSTTSRQPRPEPRQVGVKRTAGTRAVVVADPEITHAEVWLTRLEPARPPVTTVSAYRQELVDLLGIWMFNQRLQGELSDGRVAFLKAGASIWQWAGAARVVRADATAAPERWRAALADLATALQRARQHGFTPAELDEARAALIARSEQAAQQESTLPARRLLVQINAGVTRRELVTSAAQRLALEQQLMSDIQAAETSRAFAADFDPTNVIFTLLLPSTTEAPTERQLVALGRAALDIRPTTTPARERPASTLEAPARGGVVVEAQSHDATTVWSGWLDNGVRVHHRRVDQRKNEVLITITLAGGVIQEQGDNRGVTEAAVNALNRPATSTLSSSDIRTLMSGKKVRVSAGFGPDTVTLTVAGDPAALGQGLALAHVMLTDPVVEPAGFEQWRDATLQQIAARAVQVSGLLAQAEADAFYPPEETRLRPVTVSQVRALTREAVQTWLKKLVLEAPIEVAVVGDIERERATTLVARYAGSLRSRNRIGNKTLHELRSVLRPTGPLRVTRTLATQTDQAQVLDGFFAVDLQNDRESRLLTVAARVLSTRMNRTLRQDAQLVYSIGAQVRPGEAYPGWGRFSAQAPTDPTKAEALADAVEEMFKAFAAEGPTAEELTVAKKQLGNFLDETMKGPEFWRDRLAVLDYRGLSLDSLARITTDYQRFTADEVRSTFAKYFRPESRFRFVISPERPH